ncbi:putative endoribonuclease L-PSP [Rhodospirillaceae bacterium LM-1]|nr:putative endoribonuclease L-PSP [Rhodospirillaceae bacterium LM-1]
MSAIEDKLAQQGIALPQAAAPVANYVPFALTGNLLFMAGQLPLKDGKLLAVGKLGAEVGLEDGSLAARQCAINLLAQAKAALGDLDRVKRVLRLGVFVASAADFTDHPKVANGASDIMALAFGDAGRHVRTTVGCPSLPLDAAVEADAIFEFE